MTSTPPSVAIMSPGDMGHHVGAQLRRHGLRVITALGGRSERTRTLAGKAGFDIVADEHELLREADLLLSIMVPVQAEPFARSMAAIMEQSNDDVLYVDCNAIAPETASRIGAIIEAAGSCFIDAGIIGPPPREHGHATRFYASGVHANHFAQLNEFGLDVRVIGDAVGQASAIKMCYAALTKGTTALMTGLSLTAERLGVSNALRAEFDISQAAMFGRMKQHVPGMIPKAHRWVGEMEEIAKTFKAAGVTPSIFEGAADVYQDVAKTSLANVSQEEWDNRVKDYDEVIKKLVHGK
ncbi:MAG: DUF1932 domain-containing protein [Geminicoccales bacterium]